jgi:NAD(P)-dependent dehydrogenase (short-subunit alcohol dehydrogenase family)
MTKNIDISDQKDLIDQVAIVTGGGRGLGHHMARILSHFGAKVAVIARSDNELDETVKIISELGGCAKAYPADVKNASAILSIIERIEQELGTITILVNNAGDPGPIGPIWDIDLDAWLDCLNVNLVGTLTCSIAVLPKMISRNYGRIINVASGSGLQAYTYDSAYVTSKTAVIRFSENLALDTQKHGISVFSIDPGTVKTKMTESVLLSPEMDKWMPWLRNTFDKGDDISPLYAANLVHLLASGKADALSGCFISVFDDVDDMIKNKEKIKKQDLYTLRLLRPCENESHANRIVDND